MAANPHLPGVADVSEFPDPDRAPADGLVAVGGELTPERLLDAYGHGIFPWFDSDARPVLWWSPDPRAVLAPERLHVSRSLAKRLNARRYRVTVDVAFAEVIAACAAPRAKETGTWITPRMQSSYCQLHEMGYAHSVEAWRGGELIGGLYGIALGRMFFGESMFSRAADASKVALAHLARQLSAWSFTLIDCQIESDHLRSLGAVAMPRREFLHRVAANAAFETRRGRWRLHANDATPWRRSPSSEHAAQAAGQVASVAPSA